VRAIYYEITVRESDYLLIGGSLDLQPLQRDRTYYLSTDQGIVLKIACRHDTWRIKQVAGPPVRRDKMVTGGWSDCIYHPGEITAYVFGIGRGFAKADLAERTVPGYLIPCKDENAVLREPRL